MQSQIIWLLLPLDTQWMVSNGASLHKSNTNQVSDVKLCQQRQNTSQRKLLT